MIVISMLINIFAPILHRNQKKLYVNLGKGLCSPASAGLARVVLLCCKKMAEASYSKPYRVQYQDDKQSNIPNSPGSAQNQPPN